MGLFLRASYDEREDELKALGARWDPRIGRWYVDVPRDEYTRFAKWILDDTDEAIIATNSIFIIEGHQLCWQCGMSTRVIGLGIGGHLIIIDDDDGGPWCERVDEEYFGEVHLAWADREESVPAKLLEYLKGTYSVKTGNSRTMRRKCFANHCDHCGALQGNWYLFGGLDSPLVLDTFADELVDRASKLKIFEIPIDGDLLLDWEVAFGSNDNIYVEFGQLGELYLLADQGKRTVLRNAFRHPQVGSRSETRYELDPWG